MEDYIKKAADAFLVERPYGMRVDYSKRGYVLDLKKLKVYNQFIYPLAMVLNRKL